MIAKKHSTSYQRIGLAVLVIAVFLVCLGSVAAQQSSNDSEDRFENVDLEVEARLEEEGLLHLDVYFHGVGDRLALQNSLQRLPLENAEIEGELNRAGENQVKANVGLNITLKKEELSSKTEMGLSFLSGLSPETINEEFSFTLKRILLEKILGLENATADNNGLSSGLENFKITSIDWKSPVLKVSLETIVNHRKVGDIPTPADWNLFIDSIEDKFRVSGDMSVTSQKPGLRTANFDIVTGKTDEGNILGVSANVKLRMGKENGSYIPIISDLFKNLLIGRLKKSAERATGHTELKTTLTVSPHIRIEQPSKNYEIENGIYLWEGKNALTALSSLLSGKSNFTLSTVKRFIDLSKKPSEAGSVSLKPNRESYENGVRVTVTAKSNKGYKFDHWSGDASGTSETITLIMDKNRNITAHFVQLFNLETVVIPENGGTINVAPSKNNYARGEELTLTANPGKGYKFDHWSGDYPQGLEKDENITLTIESDRKITAHFSKTSPTPSLIIVVFVILIAIIVTTIVVITRKR